MPEQNKSIVWLHLSDLHFCKAKSGYDMHRVIDALYKDLKTMQDDYGLQPQLMFFTGDAAFGNYGAGAGSTLQEQYQEVDQFLTEVRQLFTVEIPKDNLFLVPGNHDVDRNEVTDDQALWLGQQQDTESVNSLIKQGGKQWQRYMERLAQYRNFLERYEYTHLLSDPERLIYHEVREVNGVKIGIGGFNSAWSCGKDQEKGKLWLGGDWQNGTIISNLKLKQVDLKLALIHHPTGWFVEHEDHVMRQQMERDFDFFLHGHEHQGWVNANVDGHVRISAAASYERADQENGYNFVRLNLESGGVEVWLRKYDASGGGWIPRIIGNGRTTNDGMWLIQNDRLAEKFKVASVKSRSLEIRQDRFEPASTNVSQKVRAEVRDKIRKLIAKPAIETIKQNLLKTQSIDPEELLVPFDVEPFPITEVIDDWHSAVRDGLKDMAEQRSNPLPQAVKTAKEIFEWLLRLAVPDAWVASKALENPYSSLKPEKNFAEKYSMWAELGNSRLVGIRPFLELAEDNFKVFSPNQISHNDLELGLTYEDALTEILKLIWVAVHKTLPPTDQDWRKQLPHTLKRRYDDGERYHITIPYSKFAAISGNRVWSELDRILRHLGIFVCATDNGEPMLIVPEDELLVAIREFLLLLGKHQ